MKTALVVGVVVLGIVNVVLTLVSWDRFVLFRVNNDDLVLNDFYLSSYVQLLLIFAGILLSLWQDKKDAFSYLIENKLERENYNAQGDPELTSLDNQTAGSSLWCVLCSWLYVVLTEKS